ncbi:MAG: hypothetical protein SPJ13_07300 [Bacteroidales bacterium]|nr:hypothetical protein [Bacteroidales bacterium]
MEALPPAQPVPLPTDVPSPKLSPQPAAALQQPAATEQSQPIVAVPCSAVRRRSRISLAELGQGVEPHPAEVRNVALEPVELSEEVLQRLWKRLLAECVDPAVSGLLYGRRVQVGDKETFVIVTTDKDFEEKFAPCKDYVERQMQAYANNPQVHCAVQIEETRKRSAYDPEEKYANMLRQNPSMETLRRLFPNLEIG